LGHRAQPAQLKAALIAGSLGGGASSAPLRRAAFSSYRRCLTATFEEVPGGTEVTLVFKNLPPGLRAEDNEAGSRLSLEQLARRFE
jgi:hypothetical protein